MRIVLATTRFPPDPAKGGIVTLYDNLARALVQAGHEVLVLTFSSGNLEPTLEILEPGLQVYKTSLPNLLHPILHELVGSTLEGTAFALGQAYKLFKDAQEIVDDFRPDVIECPEYCAYSLFWRLHSKYPVVVRCVGPLYKFAASGDIGDFSKQDVDLIMELELGLIDRADGLISISKKLACDLCGTGGLRSVLDDFKIVPIPVPALVPYAKSSVHANISHVEIVNTLDSFEPSITSSMKTDKESFSSRLFYWGRVERQKGCDLLAHSFIELKKSFPNAELVICGFENIESGASKPFADEMRRQFAEASCLASVQFLGVVDDDEIARQVALSDICVFPTRYETAGYTMLEAIALGGCVLSTTAGAVPEYLEHGVNAWLVEPDNVEALTYGLIRLLDDPALRARLENSQNTGALGKCSYESVAAGTIEVYKRAREVFIEKKVSEGAALSTTLNSVLGVVYDRLDAYRHLISDSIIYSSPAEPLAVVEMPVSERGDFEFSDFSDSISEKMEISIRATDATVEAQSDIDRRNSKEFLQEPCLIVWFSSERMTADVVAEIEALSKKSSIYALVDREASSLQASLAEFDIYYFIRKHDFASTEPYSKSWIQNIESLAKFLKDYAFRRVYLIQDDIDCYSRLSMACWLAEIPVQHLISAAQSSFDDNARYTRILTASTAESKAREPSLYVRKLSLYRLLAFRAVILLDYGIPGCNFRCHSLKVFCKLALDNLASRCRAFYQIVGSLFERTIASILLFCLMPLLLLERIRARFSSEQAAESSKLSASQRLSILCAITLGRMSFFGPRLQQYAPSLTEADSTDCEFPLRLQSKPGLFGWAQLNQLRAGTELSSHELDALDDLYVATKNSILDFKILVSTTLVLLKRYLGR